MTTYVTSADLASALDQDDSAHLQRIVQMTNSLIDEEWVDPVNPIPARVTNIAWQVAYRAGVNPKGLSSWTRSWDDISKTERMEASQRAGVYLTDEELAALNGITRTVRRAGSIRLRVPGWPG